MSFHANGADTISAVDLLKTFFEHTTEQVYTCSFPSERVDPNQVGERHSTRACPRNAVLS
jgi:hypothetical protein